MKYLLGLIVWLVCMPIEGFILSAMWGWFVVPLGVIAIGKAHAIGLAIFISIWTTDLDSKGADELVEKTSSRSSCC